MSDKNKKISGKDSNRVVELNEEGVRGSFHTSGSPMPKTKPPKENKETK